MSLSKLKSQAETYLTDLVKVTDAENRWKIRDELISFRRRMRLYCGTDDKSLYVEHMNDSITRLPDYKDWFDANGYPEAAKQCEDLQACLSEMLGYKS